MKCFNYHNKNKSICERKNCRYWINYKKQSNCCINLLEKEKNLTLEDVGRIFSVTRMRICQIEKQAIKKIRDLINL